MLNPAPTTVLVYGYTANDIVDEKIIDSIAVHVVIVRIFLPVVYESNSGLMTLATFGSAESFQRL